MHSDLVIGEETLRFIGHMSYSPNSLKAGI